MNEELKLEFNEDQIFKIIQGDRAFNILKLIEQENYQVDQEYLNELYREIDYYQSDRWLFEDESN